MLYGIAVNFAADKLFQNVEMRDYATDGTRPDRDGSVCQPGVRGQYDVEMGVQSRPSRVNLLARSPDEDRGMAMIFLLVPFFKCIQQGRIFSSPVQDRFDRAPPVRKSLPAKKLDRRRLM
jgi:hypothetical protein